ncbi:putative disease resistance protein rpp1 [Quercus suber]|uniref:Disease resistance protein rpp1 n=1 Tax=Quercus suber TaxID=58331 RepID=A0AAW0J801_QUESU
MSWSSPIRMETIFKQLTTLAFYDCHNLRDLPDSIRYLTQLTTLAFYDCHNLRDLPDCIGYLTQFTTLDFQDCHNLRDLPDSIGYLTQLTRLNFYDCHNLRDLPDSIGYLTQLTRLNLSNCHNLRDLPDSIGYLTQLAYLSLSNCHNLRDLPDSIYKLQMLQRFYFDSAKLRPPCNSFDGLSEYGFLRSHLKLQKLLDESNPSDYNHVEVTYEWEIIWWGPKRQIATTLLVRLEGGGSKLNVSVVLKYLVFCLQ